MRENNNDRRFKGRRRFRNEPNKPAVHVPILNCAICGQPIAEMVNAMAYGTEQGPCHFDCVLSEISKKNPIEPEEKITYLGSGFFGVIVEKENFQFEIRRKILVEDQNNLPEWRKDIKNLYKHSNDQ